MALGDPIFGSLAADRKVAGFTSFGLEAFGEYAAGQNERRLHNLNASLAETQAKDAIERGNEEARRVRQRRNQVIGSQRTGFAAGNVDVGTGSAADVQADTFLLSEEDANAARANAAREAWGYRTEAAFSRFKGDQAAAAGVSRASRSLLGNVRGFGGLTQPNPEGLK